MMRRSILTSLFVLIATSPLAAAPPVNPADAIAFMNQLWNRAAARLTEVPAGRVLGKKLREALPDFLGAPSPMGAIEHSLRSGQDDVLEHIAGPGAGSRVYEVRLHPFSDGVTIFFSEIMLRR